MGGQRTLRWNGLVRYADDFVILSRPGQGPALRQRLIRWLKAKGLSLNEEKTRIVDFCEESFNFLGFALSWRRGKNGWHYAHVEPSAKSQQHLRDTVRVELNHWTRWRGIEPSLERVNRILRGWSGYYHYRNSSRVFRKLKWWMQTRLKRWLWRSPGKPDTVNPSVRFDEGRKRTGHWPSASQSSRFRLLYGVVAVYWRALSIQPPSLSAWRRR